MIINKFNIKRKADQIWSAYFYLLSVEIKENLFKRKKYVCDFKLDIYSNKLVDIVIIQNMNENLVNNINKNLIL